MSIKEVNVKTAKSIVINRMPFSRFLVNGDESFIAIENTTGDAQVEHFETEKEALAFLRA